MGVGYRIKEVADKTGFTPATLRYYEEIGLLPPAARSASGYRMYGGDTIERLTFIGRAKQLGCSLDEIADLSVAWDGGVCGLVQTRLRAIVSEKIAEAQARLVDLMTLTADLQRAAAALERHRPDGPCDATCGCISDPTDAPRSPQLVSLGRKPYISSTQYLEPPHENQQ